MSVSNLEQNETVKDALKTILTEMAEEYETSYNFGGQLTFSETDILDFPRMFAKMGGKKWKSSKDECTLLSIQTFPGLYGSALTVDCVGWVGWLYN